MSVENLHIIESLLIQEEARLARKFSRVSAASIGSKDRGQYYKGLLSVIANKEVRVTAVLTQVQTELFIRKE